MRIQGKKGSRGSFTNLSLAECKQMNGVKGLNPRAV